jgi:hypothetical protein
MAPDSRSATIELALKRLDKSRKYVIIIKNAVNDYNILLEYTHNGKNKCNN